jgi:hypothetical protein
MTGWGGGGVAGAARPHTHRLWSDGAGIVAMCQANASYGAIRASAASIAVANRPTGDVCGPEVLAR